METGERLSRAFSCASISDDHSVASAIQEIGECVQNKEEQEWFDGVCHKFNQQQQQQLKTQSAHSTRASPEQRAQVVSPSKAPQVDFTTTQPVSKERRWFQSLFQKFDSYCSRIEEEAEKEEAAEADGSSAHDDESPPTEVSFGSEEDNDKSSPHDDRVARLLVSISRIGTDDDLEAGQEESEEDDDESDDEDDDVVSTTSSFSMKAQQTTLESPLPSKGTTRQASQVDDGDDSTVATSVTTAAEINHQQESHPLPVLTLGGNEDDPNLLAYLLEQELLSSCVAQRVLRKVDNLCITRTASWRHLRRMSNSSTTSNHTMSSTTTSTIPNNHQHHGLGTMIQQHPRAFGGVWDVDSPPTGQDPVEGGGEEEEGMLEELIMDDATIASLLTVNTTKSLD